VSRCPARSEQLGDPVGGGLSEPGGCSAAERGKVSEFLVVVEDRLPDLRRSLYAADVVWTRGGDDRGGRWLR
jgi:hypothetical protein